MRRVTFKILTLHSKEMVTVEKQEKWKDWGWKSGKLTFECLLCTERLRQCFAYAISFRPHSIPVKQVLIEHRGHDKTEAH